MNPAPPLKFLQWGDWSPGQIRVTWTENHRKLIPEVEASIESAWRETFERRPGVNLFDGPMCRIESWRASPDLIELELSPSSYKAFLGTNMANPHWVDRYGPAVMANPVGVSPAVVSADNYLLLGRRNASVAYYPGRLHPFAGCMEPKDADPFAAVRRELAEELSLDASEIVDLKCTGIAEDQSLRQPEMIFAARITLTRAEIEKRLDRQEHQATWSTFATQSGVDAALRDASQMTPVAIAALLLWGRIDLGDDWFAKQCGDLAIPLNAIRGAASRDL